MAMQSRPEFFLVTSVLLVPFLYISSSIPDACARPAPGIDTICLGDDLSEKGEKCCWKVTGEKDSHFVCHTCWKKFNDQGSIERCTAATTVTFNNPLPRPQDRPPGGGVFQFPNTNATSPDR